MNKPDNIVGPEVPALYYCLYCKDPHESKNFESNFPICTKGHYLVPVKDITLQKHIDNMKQLGHDILDIQSFIHTDTEGDDNFGFPNYETDEDKMYVR